jgi:hypothetical protein
MVDTNGMDALIAAMVKAKGDSGVVVFLEHRLVPVAVPRRGRPLGTREEAEAEAREFLANPDFVRAWTVGRDGIREVLLSD